MNKEDVAMVMGMLEGIIEGVEENPEILKRFAKLMGDMKINLTNAGFTEQQAFELLKATAGKK